MHPELLIRREKNNRLYCGAGVHPKPTAFHFHSLNEIYLVESGEVDVWINQKQKKLKAGEMAVVLSYDAHRYEPSKDAVITYLIVPADMLKELDGKSIVNPFIENRELFGHILSLCRIISENRNPLLTNGCIQTVFGLLFDEMQFSKRETVAERGKLTDVLLYLHDHFKRNVTLTNASSALGYNASYLSRIFKQSLGMSFHQYLNMLRLREAAVLLSKGNTSEYCAFESGFRSVRTFYRAFSEEFGCTPGEYASEAKER